MPYGNWHRVNDFRAVLIYDSKRTAHPSSAGLYRKRVPQLFAFYGVGSNGHRGLCSAVLWRESNNKEKVKNNLRPLIAFKGIG